MLGISKNFHFKLSDFITVVFFSYCILYYLCEAKNSAHLDENFNRNLGLQQPKIDGFCGFFFVLW